MKSYVKPVILANDELAEGVYAASGAVDGGGESTGSGGVSVSSVELKTAGNEYYRVNTYDVKIENSGSTESSDWSAKVSVTSGTASKAETYNGWLASVSLNGNTITITPGGGGAIPAGGSVTVEVVVFYNGDSVTVE